ncbi:hypothetical protein A2276_01455 [candidate division WOR-1 bacterium RIFOXYA12_FULL_43_27]|uniref:histidine kinase n=1 Tax=candidate division WOR-1 bacterium RIFOXYC2_FULL_46_14 TaxID=1802587 RepID=A0A1F4U563_UNCSA|nr:MAG: hypothetical protein A2276_01455 [candidate division WOR-1 bacterium RIFOXYA12_FULL_43_27]OGC20649.1 MAG: hypothetical protein A2292_06420 [candidate division WOR-1 bacterium RIFOXYB2_FULL_46_45]OGC31614.1 MAG: hypothetical protein A2232_05030 [candidate division WOR-1 bacterium RIFOXYA2_FULL_46_56]OGC40019.1 MAG: hypothetical protein A2438_05875 [candidate division WOR-1 bacterium RIFOXYC2_FULL_46_14]
MWLMLSPTGIVLLAAATINSGLSVFIFLRGKEKKENIFFSALLLLLALLSLVIFLASSARDELTLLYWVRFAYAATSLLPAVFLCFSLVFTEDAKKGLSEPVSWLIFSPAFLFLFLSFTPLIEKKAGFPFYLPPEYGPAMPFFSLYVMLYALIGFLVLAKKYLGSRGRERLQVWYVLFGVAATSVLMLLANIVLPQFFKTAEWAALGPASTLILAGSVSYAMIRHRLLNSEDFLWRAIVFLFFLSGAIGTFLILAEGSTNVLLTFYIVLSLVFMGIFAVLQGYKNGINFSFSLIAFAMAVWIFGVSVVWTSKDPVLVDFWGKAAFTGASFIPALMLYFSRVFPKELRAVLWAEKAAIFLPLLIFPILIWNNQVISEVIITPAGFVSRYGMAYLWFVLYILLFLVWAFFNLLKSYRTLSGLYLDQLKYLFVGFFLTAIVAVATNLILPFMGISEYSFVGPNAAIIMVAFTGYAIIRHRLLAIEVVIQKSFVYTVTSILIIALYVLGVYLSEQFLQGFFGYTSVLATAFLVFVIAAIFQPLLKITQNLADRIFVRKRLDYQRALRNVSQDILSRIKLEDVAQLIVSTFIDVVEISEISFLVFNRKSGSFESVNLHGKAGLGKYKKIELSAGNNLANFFLSSPGPLAIEALQEEVVRRGAEGNKAGAEELTRILSEIYPFEFKLWIPVIGKNGLAAIIALGEKSSHEGFSAEDLRLFSTLANQTALSLENVRLYQEVMEMRNYNQEVLDSLPSGVLTTDYEGKIVTCNPAMEKIIGKKYEELEGKKYSDIFSDKSPLYGAVASTLKDKCLYNFEAGILNPRKGIVPLLINTTLLGTPRDKTGMLLSARDMTEVRDLENKARQADKLKALGIMSAGMAHEIKNPLSSLRIMAQILPLKFDDPVFRKKMLEIIPTEVGRIDRIVENLLRFARTTEMKLSKVNIGEYLEGILKDYLKQAEENKVKIVKNYSRLPEIMLDPEQFTQVFTNLILNAIQAMPEGGTLTLTTKIGRQLENFIQGIVIEISDTGHGISEENLAHLFDPFFTTKHGGTGLGLTIVHSLVEAHQGEIKVLSKIGEGTTFRIYLPVQQ